MLYISIMTGWSIPEPPKIEYVENDRKMFMLLHECDKQPDLAICKNYDPKTSTQVLALYNYHIKTILLYKDFSLSSIKDQSILLHELVHHMQYSEKYIYYTMLCRGYTEKEALDIQEAWLLERNLTLEEAIEIGPLYRALLTMCDIHPSGIYE